MAWQLKTVFQHRPRIARRILLSAPCVRYHQVRACQARSVPLPCYHTPDWSHPFPRLAFFAISVTATIVAIWLWLPFRQQCNTQHLKHLLRTSRLRSGTTPGEGKGGGRKITYSIAAVVHAFGPRQEQQITDDKETVWFKRPHRSIDTNLTRRASSWHTSPQHHGQLIQHVRRCHCRAT